MDEARLHDLSPVFPLFICFVKWNRRYLLITAQPFSRISTSDAVYVNQLYINYTVSQKNIPDIFDCNLKTNCQILIIFGTNLPDKTCHHLKNGLHLSS